MKNIYLVAGDSHTFTFNPYMLKQGIKASADSNIYNLKLIIRGINSLDLIGISNNENWVCELNIIDSLKLQASKYTCAVILYWDNDNKRQTVEEFNLIVNPNLTNVQNFDNRCEAEKALSECQKALAKFNNEGILVKKLQIGSRIIEFNSITELLELAKYWEQQVFINNQNNANKLGVKNNKMLQIGFTRG